MHIADFSRGVLGANAIVGGGISLAVGAALAAQTLDDGRVAVTFFGDGASSQGILHESLNLAAVWRLPVVFVCENNGWAESTPARYAVSVPDIADRAAGYGIPGVVVDAVDYVQVLEAARAAVGRARSGQGPSLIEAKIERHSGHYVGDPEGYRAREQRAAARKHDPISHLRARLEGQGTPVDALVETWQNEVVAELDQAFDAARSAPWPDPEEVERDVYA